MSQFAATATLALAFLAVFFVFMSVRLIFKKNGEFQGTCASQSPWLNKEGVTCSVCGKDPNFCENDDNDGQGGDGQPKEQPMPTILPVN